MLWSRNDGYASGRMLRVERLLEQEVRRQHRRGRERRIGSLCGCMYNDDTTTANRAPTGRNDGTGRQIEFRMGGADLSGGPRLKQQRQQQDKKTVGFKQRASHLRDPKKQTKNNLEIRNPRLKERRERRQATAP
ncbi:hypothetical protein VTJ04DRAFT_1397 [Mycothermus thermophilus]|uniref:uncharacterized protein n=1 Tax=Humicola insolens TaxID=85995 RepID=UPI00374276D4